MSTIATSEFIYFESAAQFRDRPGYRTALQCGPPELERIVGKYSFAKSDALTCGLNNCNQPHQTGYVIRLRDGRETHCGQQCGARSFGGILWQDVQAVFHKGQSTEQRLLRIQAVLDEKTSLLQSANELHTKLVDSVSRVQRVLTEMAHDKPLQGAFLECVRNGGRIQIAQRVDKDLREVMGITSGQANIQTLATITGYDAVDECRTVIYEFSRNVLQVLQGITEEGVSAMGAKEVERVSRAIGDVRPHVVQTHGFMRRAENFCDPTNLAKLWLLRQTMSKRNVTERTERVLRRATGSAEPREEAA